MKLKTKTIQMLSDQMTPVSAYLKIRDISEFPMILESNDSQSAENSKSFVGFDPLIELYTEGDRLIINTLGRKESIACSHVHKLPELLNQVRKQITVSGDHSDINGFFGHTNFEAVRYFDAVNLNKNQSEIPEIHYFFYRYLIVFDHYRDQLTLIENVPDGEPSDILKIKKLLLMGHYEEKGFKCNGPESSDMTDDEFKDLVVKGKHHCKVGDVFQIVMSRKFIQPFEGDDFTVYRVLRSINPSPYLYYFDFGSYRIFGSSPESQLIIDDQTARVNPIAGTYRRSGNDAEDARRAAALKEDAKEVSEHTMLVDLARNDLGRHTTEVEVKSLMEVQYFSHVIHLVSTVEGKLPSQYNPFRVYGDTFPAGTLSGAPKIKAMELIHEYEHSIRHFYGGGIGYIGLDGNITQAIVIRSFLSKDNVLYSRAGAGIVISSDEESELQEVNNKLAALKSALKQAETIFEIQ
ncbi:anthranilate synthase component I family protein [Membranihabitans marinus]|uniref:anthranilate synthase component I family protein n=1 Tax=Membranihabitans marinus TaxID=1227546 RepID=UPI001F18E156|nr:anthranilate synthase component I family protein [Membranihabitans marinus]